MTEFKPYKTIIMVQPGQRNNDNWLALLVEFYAPGCFRTEKKVAEANSYNAARNQAQEAARFYHSSM